MLRRHHGTGGCLVRRLSRQLVAVLTLVTAIHIDHGVVYTVRRVLLRGARPIATLRDSNPSLLVSVRGRDAAHLDLAVRSRSLELLRQWATALTGLLRLSRLLLLVQLDLLLVQLLARRQVEIVNDVRDVGHAISRLRALGQLAALAKLLLLLVLEVRLDLRDLSFALSIFSLHEALAVQALRHALLLLIVNEASAHLLALARVQAARALEALVVRDALLTTTNLSHARAASRVLWRHASRRLITQVHLNGLALLVLLEVLRGQVLGARLLYLVRVRLQPRVDERLLDVQ